MFPTIEPITGAKMSNLDESSYEIGQIDGRISEIESTLVLKRADKLILICSSVATLGGLILAIPTGGVSLLVSGAGVLFTSVDIARKQLQKLGAIDEIRDLKEQREFLAAEMEGAGLALDNKEDARSVSQGNGGFTVFSDFETGAIMSDERAASEADAELKHIKSAQLTEE